MWITFLTFKSLSLFVLSLILSWFRCPSLRVQPQNFRSPSLRVRPQNFRSPFLRVRPQNFWSLSLRVRPQNFRSPSLRARPQNFRSPYHQFVNNSLGRKNLKVTSSVAKHVHIVIKTSNNNILLLSLFTVIKVAPLNRSIRFNDWIFYNSSSEMINW